MENQNEHITPVEARMLLEVITTLATNCMFSKEECEQIARICNKCLDRLDEEGLIKWVE